MGGRRPMGTRQSSTMAAQPPRQQVQTHTPPPPARAAPVQGQAGASQGPGLFGQMASTAAGVAVGSTIGHTLGAGITSMFSGGGNSDNAQAMDQQQQQQLQQQPMIQDTANNSAAGACAVDARNFTRCLDENNGDLSPCNFYLQQLKACQEAARQY